MKPIVFIHKMDAENQQQWLDIFTNLLPKERFVLQEQLTDEEALSIELAIVANPDVKILERFPNLIWVQSLWAGVESLVDSFKEFNEQKANETKLVRLIDPHLADTMAEAVLTWTLYLHRNIPEYIAQQRNKIWKEIPCLASKNIRVSILGAGELGLASIQRLLQSGYQVNCWSRSHKEIEGVKHYNGDEGLISLLKNTDILVCLLPLTQQTYQLLNKETLCYLPLGAKLINFARGGIINHADLLKLLDLQQISHAVLDVFEQEPLQTNSPLWTHPNISILPHISATTNIETASKVVANNILIFRKEGTIPTSVDLKKGY